MNQRQSGGGTADASGASQPLARWLWDEVEIGQKLAPYAYLVSAEMLAAYRQTVENPTAAYPTVAGRNPLRAFNQQFGKQTLMNVGIEAEYFAEVLPDKELRVTAHIADKYIRRDKPYIVVEARTEDEDGRLIEISRVIGLAAKPDKPLFSEVANKWKTE